MDSEDLSKAASFIVMVGEARGWAPSFRASVYSIVLEDGLYAAAEYLDLYAADYEGAAQLADALRSLADEDEYGFWDNLTDLGDDVVEQAESVYGTASGILSSKLVWGLVGMAVVLGAGRYLKIW